MNIFWALRTWRKSKRRGKSGMHVAGV